MNEPITSDTILDYMKGLVESKTPIARETWLEVAFKLVLLRLDEAKLYNKMRKAVAEKKLEILKNQEKKNVSLADVEIESLSEYQFLKDQEDKLYTIDELVRVSKKSADINF